MMAINEPDPGTLSDHKLIDVAGSSQDTGRVFMNEYTSPFCAELTLFEPECRGGVCDDVEAFLGADGALIQGYIPSRKDREASSLPWFLKELDRAVVSFEL